MNNISALSFRNRSKTLPIPVALFTSMSYRSFKTEFELN